jgi:hypothetical protein
MAYEAPVLHWAQTAADSTGVKVKGLAREGLNLVTVLLPSGSRSPSVPPFASQLPRDSRWCVRRPSGAAGPGTRLSTRTWRLILTRMSPPRPPWVVLVDLTGFGPHHVSRRAPWLRFPVCQQRRKCLCAVDQPTVNRAGGGTSRLRGSAATGTRCAAHTRWRRVFAPPLGRARAPSTGMLRRRRCLGSHDYRW